MPPRIASWQEGGDRLARPQRKLHRIPHRIAQILRPVRRDRLHRIERHKAIAPGDDRFEGGTKAHVGIGDPFEPLTIAHARRIWRLGKSLIPRRFSLICLCAYLKGNRAGDTFHPAAHANQHRHFCLAGKHVCAL
jgi:hypothetical protein